MAVEIDKQIINEASKCNKDCVCISSQSSPYCSIKDCVVGEIHFINCLEANFCPYKIPFGEGIVCSCPVRKEIYNKYKV